MAESITRSKNDYNQQSIEVAEESNSSPEGASQDRDVPVHQPIVIWTPRFIVVFALILIVGLSMASLLTQGWENHYYASEHVLLAEIALLWGSWITVIIRARTLWARIGAIFGCFWAMCMGISFVASLLQVEAGLPIIAYLNATTNIALLGCYTGLSLNRTATQRWDARFFSIAPLVLLGSCIGGAAYFLFVANSPQTLAGILAAVALYLGIGMWWLRPSCWQTQPAATFFFGIAPVILLILAIPHLFNAVTNFFFLQVSLLCFLLGVVRTLQGEMRRG